MSDEGLTRAQVEIVKQLTADVERLTAWVADLQSGMYVNCVYCGHRYGPGETTPVSMADALKAHIAQCPEHPMSGLLAAAREFDRLSLVIESSVRHDCGPSRPDHEAVVAAIKATRAAIAKAVQK
jgi:hypothetical protein